MNYPLFWSISFVTLLLLSPLQMAAEESLTREERLALYLELDDPHGALSLAKREGADEETLLQILASFPRGEMHQELQENLSRVLQTARKTVSSKPPLSKERVEKIAWAFIRKSSNSHNLQQQLAAACHAASMNSVEGVLLLSELLRQPSPIKEYLLKAASALPDSCFIEAAAQSLREEDQFVIRREAIRLLGTRRDPKAKVILEEHLKKPFLNSEELIETLAALRPHLRFTNLSPPTSGISSLEKLLLIQAAMENPSRNNITAIAHFIMDPDERVEQMAILALGLFGREKIHLKGTPLQEAYGLRLWAIARNSPTGSPEADSALLTLEQACFSTFPHIRQQAITLICSLGNKSTPTLLRLLSKQTPQGDIDPMVQLHAAVTLTRQGDEVGAKALLELLKTFPERISKANYLLFPMFQLSNVPNSPFIPRLPELVDTLTRLELIALVARNSSLDVKPLLQHYLLQKPFGISGEAALYLHREYAHEGLEFIQELLQDNNQTIRLQAALILGILFQDGRGVSVLLEEYPKAPFDLKIVILQALGASDQESVRYFLIQQLLNPSEEIQLEAAGALLRSLR